MCCSLILFSLFRLARFIIGGIMSRRAAKGDYIETDSGNKVARKAILVGTQNIMLGGKTVIQPDVMIRGDLVRSVAVSASGSSPANTTAVAIGRYCFLAKGVLLRPPGRLYKGAFTYMPLRLGDHVFVGQGSVIQAATVGSHVHVGARCTVNDFAIIKDYVKILDDTVVPSFMVIPSFSIVAGQPARVVGEVPEGGHDDFELRDLYKTVGNNPQPPASPTKVDRPH
ncbi:dynactin 5 [Ophiocordyceps camponoti-floridani]|uniref:Dynactin subunit 5 n=1 Tax=Ophiocordyceps camponoti-floridani TaxID=2030778 RepID=A0A8H4VGY7_9HYPO|nr:dynactin 5 [Ophiocordyceps camponoti-floridani]